MLFGVGAVGRQSIVGKRGLPLAAPTVDLSFMTPGSLDGRIVFTRTTTATYFDSSGTMQTAAINTPRWDYDPITHVLKGVLIEESRINVLLNSSSLGTQSVTVTAQQYFLSFYGTGTVTLSGTATGSLVGTGPQRVSMSFTPTAGSLTLTVTGTVTNAQLEAGQFVTSYIPTTAAAVTRAQDNATMPTSGWLTSTTSGSLLTEYNVVGMRTAGFPVIVRLDDGTANNNISHQISATLGRMYSVSTVATVQGWALGNNSTYTVNTIHKMATAWDVGVQRFNLNGIQPQSSTVASATPASVTTLHLGQDQAANIFKAICLRRVAYWPSALSAKDLQNITT